MTKCHVVHKICHLVMSFWVALRDNGDIMAWPENQIGLLKKLKLKYSDANDVFWHRRFYWNNIGIRNEIMKQ